MAKVLIVNKVTTFSHFGSLSLIHPIILIKQEIKVNEAVIQCSFDLSKLIVYWRRI